MQLAKHISITGALKATPATEGDQRFLYIEASNEAVDQQGETILAKALQESTPYYQRYGNLDLDHITQIGAQRGIKDYHFFEIGRPVEVQIGKGRTFVKGHIYQGDGPAAEKANAFWNSLHLTPPHRWYPSVGGAVTKAANVIDDRKGKHRVISGVRWSNIGFSKTPVNQEVSEVSMIPIGAFAKAFTADGLDLKALEAGYGSDMAALQNAGALRKQSLEGGAPLSYLDFRNRISGDINSKKIKDPDPKGLLSWATSEYGLSHSNAAEWVERFMTELSLHMKNPRSAK